MPIEKAQAVEAARLAELNTQFEAMPSVWPEKITLEIGCGHGHFLAAYAAAHPREYCIGVDIIRDRLERAGKKTERAGLTNVSFFHTDARMFLQNLPEPVTLGRIIVLFPDPWPKRRHHKNRLINSEFLDLLAERAAPGATLYFRTDHGPYFEQTYSTLLQHKEWGIEVSEWPFEHDTVFQNRAPNHQSWIAKVIKNA